LLVSVASEEVTIYVRYSVRTVYCKKFVVVNLNLFMKFSSQMYLIDFKDQNEFPTGLREHDLQQQKSYTEGKHVCIRKHV